MPNYISTHQKRSDHKKRALSVYFHNSLNFKTRADVSINSKDVESVTLEIVSERVRNSTVNILYRPRNGHFEPFKNFLRTFFLNTKNCNTNIHIAGDFNLDFMDYAINKKVQTYLNLIPSKELYSKDKQSYKDHKKNLRYFSRSKNVRKYIYIYIYTSKVFKRKKQLIWYLKFHADTAAIFSQMNKTLNLQYHGFFCII